MLTTFLIALLAFPPSSFFLLPFSFSLLPFSWAQSTAPDEPAVRDVVRRYVDARNRSDAAAIRALFTDDADQLTSSGEWRRGVEEIVRGTSGSSQANPGARTIAIETVRFPASGIALADGHYEIGGSGQAAPRRMWTSFVIVRSGNAWRIAAIRNMLPAAMPAAVK